MAANWQRATVRSRASNSPSERRRHGAIVALLAGATLSAATLGSGVFAASAPAPLAADATQSPATRNRPDVAIAERAPQEEAAPQDRTNAEPLVAAPLTAKDTAAIDDAIRALADDGIPRNGVAAVHALRDFGDKAVPALQRALDSADEQQRHLAAFVLRWTNAAPTRRLCELSVEALGDPEIEGYWRSLIHRPALSATRWLDANAQTKEVTQHLLAAVRSEHAQRRFLAAAMLARAGVQRDLPQTCSVLIAQLPDNSRDGDALVAAHALYRLGPAALPQIRLAYRGADEQARSLLQLVEESLDDDAAGRTRTEAELRERYQRLGLRKVTNARIDPARAHPFLGIAALPRL